MTKMYGPARRHKKDYELSPNSAKEPVKQCVQTRAISIKTRCSVEDWTSALTALGKVNHEPLAHLNKVTASILFRCTSI